MGAHFCLLVRPPSRQRLGCDALAGSLCILGSASVRAQIKAEPGGQDSEDAGGGLSRAPRGGLLDDVLGNRAQVTQRKLQGDRQGRILDWVGVRFWIAALHKRGLLWCAGWGD